MTDPGSGPELPRSVLLALWLASSAERVGHDPTDTAGTAASVERAVRAVVGVAESHLVTGPGTTSVPLASAISTWCVRPLTAAAVLPVPGDPAGVPPQVSAAATEAGECVLLNSETGNLALIPQAEEFGSQWERGVLVTWSVHEVEPWVGRFLGTIGAVPEAERELRHGLLTATEALVGLDVARWRPDAAEAIKALRGDRLPDWQLPPGLDQRTVRVLALAARLRMIVEIAVADDGGAINLWQADQRSTALREVERVARRALAAASLSGPAGPGRAGESRGPAVAD